MVIVYVEFQVSKVAMASKMGTKNISGDIKSNLSRLLKCEGREYNSPVRIKLERKYCYQISVII